MRKDSIIPEFMFIAEVLAEAEAKLEKLKHFKVKVRAKVNELTAQELIDGC